MLGLVLGVPCDYKCVFGISRPLKAFPAGLQLQVLGNGHSYLIASGPGGRLYWFLFASFGGRKYGKDIPRYTKEDEALFAKQHEDDALGEGAPAGRLGEAGTPSRSVGFGEFEVARHCDR